MTSSLGLALFAAVGASLLAATSRAARSAANELHPAGLLTSFLRGMEVGARGAALIALLAAAVALIPEGARWLLPWGGAAVALAVGWSARDVLQDWIAWTMLITEGHLRRGTWVRGEDFEGIVQSLRPRVLWVRDERGRLTTIPNRVVARSVLRTDPGGYPEVEIAIDLPGIAPDVARAALTEAVWMSPWLAPEPMLTTSSVGELPDRWSVRVRIVDLTCWHAFVGTFPERVQESLRTRSPGHV